MTIGREIAAGRGSAAIVSDGVLIVYLTMTVDVASSWATSSPACPGCEVQSIRDDTLPVRAVLSSRPQLQVLRRRKWREGGTDCEAGTSVTFRLVVVEPHMRWLEVHRWVHRRPGRGGHR
jgi:hypothetical protein